MGSRGPAPHPAALKLAKGNGVDRDADGHKVARQPQAARAIPPMPAGLNDDGRYAWDLVVPELYRMGLLGQIDGITLEAYCRLYQVWRRHDGRTGYAALTAQLLAAGSRLGCDPASRLRMTLPEPAADAGEGDVFAAG